MHSASPASRLLASDPTALTTPLHTLFQQPARVFPAWPARGTVETTRRDLIPPEFPGLARLAARTRHVPVEVEVLPGDVGRRRYVRLVLAGGRSVLGVVYPAEEDDARRRWIAARDALRSRLRVPQLIADDLMGNQLVEDFGRQDLAQHLVSSPEDRRAWLDRAADAAAELADLPDPGVNAPFGVALFRRELDLAREAVFDLYQARPLSPPERQDHDDWADALCAEVAAHPFVLCHRDFHGNNLFPVDEEVGLIDFQDLRRGPDSYDLASLLLERTTLDWMTPGLSREVMERFAARRGLVPESFRDRLHRVLLQRTWKVCGTFARAVAAGRGEVYRGYLPAELTLVAALLSEGPPDRAMAAILRARLPDLC